MESTPHATKIAYLANQPIPTGEFHDSISQDMNYDKLRLGRWGLELHPRSDLLPTNLLRVHRGPGPRYAQFIMRGYAPAFFAVLSKSK